MMQEIQELIDRAVQDERGACAAIAESEADPAGTLARGQTIEEVDAVRKVCLKIAERVRMRSRPTPKR